jgi:ParB family chromosome partitioning protein
MSNSTPAPEPAVTIKSQKGKSRVIQVSMTEIRPYWRNPRINDEAVGFVAESIKRFGFVVPIVLDQENVIIAGHCRYRAAQQLKLKKVPVIVIEISDELAKQYRIADNKTSEFAVWDKEKLAEELSALEDLTAVKDLFAGPEWMALLRKDDPSFSAGGDSTPGSGDNTGEQTQKNVVVPCPHCGENNILKLVGDTVEGALPNENPDGSESENQETAKPKRRKMSKPEAPPITGKSRQKKSSSEAGGE